MRLLLASDFYPPFIGGTELQVRMLAERMARLGHEVTVATVWHAGLDQIEWMNGVRVVRLRGLTVRLPMVYSDPSRRRYHPPFPDPGIVIGLRKLIRKARPDVMHANNWIAFSCAAAVVGTGVPLMVSVRDAGYSCATKILMRGSQVCDGPSVTKCLPCARENYGYAKGTAAVLGVAASRELLRTTVSGFHSVSNFVQEIVNRDLVNGLQAVGMLENVVIPDINVSLQHQTTGEPGDEHSMPEALPNEPYILFVGALQPHKGVNQLLDAYRLLRNAPPLVLIGTTYPNSPTEFPTGVTAIANVPHEVVLRAWERSLFGVAPSIWPDSFPGTVHEAMGKGKPVVGTAMGGIVDMVVHGETGLLVPAHDVAALARAMQRLIDDPVLRDRLGQAARDRVEQRYTESQVVPRFERMYRVLSRKDSNRAAA